MFQSTPPRGRRPVPITALRLLLTVSIHASAWEATSTLSRAKATARLFQSTPPRGRRLSVDSAVLQDYNVSIHASAWEATEHIGQQEVYTQVSIHASAWEATACRRADSQRPCLFQSTPPRGRRLFIVRLQRSRGGSFNPRLRVGGDACALASRPRPCGFNPRLRVGGDWYPQLPLTHAAGFNPRLRVGGDQ